MMLQILRLMLNLFLLFFVKHTEKKIWEEIVRPNVLKIARKKTMNSCLHCISRFTWTTVHNNGIARYSQLLRDFSEKYWRTNGVIFYK